MNSCIGRIPAKYRSSIRDAYQDEDGWWICLKCDGPYILEGYDSDYTIHEDTISDAIKELREHIIKK
jgi:hypothetical protein